MGMLQKVGKRLKDQKGLTLIELLAVIVILGIIAAIAIPAIGNIIQKSKVDAVKSDAIQILNAAKTYVAANGVPDTSPTTLDKAALEPYVDSKYLDNLTVTVTVDATNKVTYAISGSVPAGKQTVKFTKATIADINSSGNSVTVPKP